MKDAVMSRAGARTWLQPMGHGDMQGFDSSFAAICDVVEHGRQALSCFRTIIDSGSL